MNGWQSQCTCHPQLLAQCGCQCRYERPSEVAETMRAIRDAGARVILAQLAEIADLKRELATLRAMVGR